MNHQRYVMLVFLIGALLAGVFVHQAVVSALLQFAVPDDVWVGGLFSTSSLAAALAGIASFFLLIRNQNAVRFTGEVVAELAKVTWPTRDETVRASTTVILTAIGIAMLMGVFDLFWKTVADFVLYTEG